MATENEEGTGASTAPPSTAIIDPSRRRANEEAEADESDDNLDFSVAGVDLFDTSKNANRWGRDLFSVGGDGERADKLANLKAKIDNGTATDSERDSYSNLSSYDRTYHDYRHGYVIGNLRPTEEMIEIRELSIAHHTPTGWRLTRGTAEMMFTKGWDFVSEKGATKDKNEPLEPQHVYDALVKANHEFNFKQHFITAEEKARALHHCLFIKFQVAERGQRQKFVPRIAIIKTNSQIDWENGHPVKYRPVLRVGNSDRQFEFTTKEAFLWIHNQDPLGNMYQGRSVLVPVYWTIRRMENMIDAYILIILMRGLGRLILKIDKVQSPEQAATWADKFKQLAQRHILVVGKGFEWKLEEGMKKGYDYPAVLKTQISQVATGSGYPAAHLSGDNEGVLASAKTGQDTTGGQIKAAQQMTENNMTKAYKLFVPILEPHAWEYEWDYQIEHDEVEKANIVARKVSTAAQMGFLSTGFVYQYLDQDLPAGADPDMPFAHFLSKIEEENPYEPEDQFEMGEGEAGELRPKKKETEKPGAPPMKKKEGAKEQQTTKAELKKPANENAGQAKKAAEKGKGKDEDIQMVINADDPPPGCIITEDGTVLPTKEIFMGLSRHVFGHSVGKTELVMQKLYGEAKDHNKIAAIEKRDLFKDLDEKMEEE